MYELLDQHRMFHSTCLDDFKNLKDLLDRFEVRTLECLSNKNHQSSPERCLEVNSVYVVRVHVLVLLCL